MSGFPDETAITVDPVTYAAFLAQLSAPSAPNQRLVRTMTFKPPWDETTLPEGSPD